MTDNYGWPTTRCYPRTTEEAFKHLGCDPEWFHPPEKNDSPMNALVLACAIWMWVGLAYWWTNA